MEADHSRHGLLSLRKSFFSDLTHYIRSGDFIQALLRDSKTSTNLALPSAPWRITLRTTTDRSGINRAFRFLYPACGRNSA